MPHTATLKLGRDYLKERSRLSNKLNAMKIDIDVLVVEDIQSDLDLVLSNLRLATGGDTQIRQATDIKQMLDAVRYRIPTIVLLDDLLQSKRAESSIPALRAVGFAGSIVIISGLVTRTRLVELNRLGVRDVIHKDDINSSRLKESLLRCL
jgi:DNA-binding NtrC family response regulator